MRFVTVLTLGFALLAPSLLGGCLSVQAAKDYWNDQGVLVVKAGTLAASSTNGQRLQDFSEFKVAIQSVLAVPVGEIASAAETRYAPQPYGLDLSARFEEGEGKKVLESRITTKTIDRVSMSLFLVKATTKAGVSVPGCAEKEADRVHPCVALPKGGVFVLDKSADPAEMKRGKTLTMEFPIVVMYDAESDEYFLQSRSSREEAPVQVS